MVADPKPDSEAGENDGVTRNSGNSRGYFIKILLLVTVISLATVVCLVISFVGIRDDKIFVASKIVEFERNRLASAKGLAEGIAWKFEKLNNALDGLSQIPAVQFLESENEAILNMIRSYRANRSLVDGIFRYDREHKLRLAFPANAAKPPSFAVTTLLEQARTTGKSAIVTARNADGKVDQVIFAKPIYRMQGKVYLHPNNKYSGLVLFTINLKKLNKSVFKFLTPGRSINAFVITNDSIIVGAKEESVLGQFVETALRPSLTQRNRNRFLEITEEMARRQTGSTYHRYEFDPRVKAPSQILFPFPGRGKSSDPLRGESSNTENRVPESRLHTNLLSYTPIPNQLLDWSFVLVSQPSTVQTLIDDKRWIYNIVLLGIIVVLTVVLIAFIRDQREVQVRELAINAEKLRLAKVEAEEGSRAKSEFLATMSHEIRTPLHGILGTAKLMLGSDLSVVHRKYADTIKRSGDALLSLINDILDLSKIESGRLSLEIADFQLNRVLGDVTALFELSAQQKGLKFEIHIAADVPEVIRGDPEHIRQVLFNLVGNAIKFTECGGIILCVTQKSLEGADCEIRFEVRDTGIGIDARNHEQIFDRFAQADGSTTRKFGGTGLGLAICKELTQLMGGAIGVRNNSNHGSTFWFTVRCEPGDATNIDDQVQADRSDEPVEAVKIRPLRILVAEDNEINQMIVTDTLKTVGHHVDVVSNGVEALQAVAAHPFDLILMDLSMPEMDGLTATKRIRKMPGESSKLPIVALTANAMAGEREKCLAAGMNDFVAKPFEANQLFATIHDCLEATSPEEGRNAVPPSDEGPGTAPETCLDPAIVDPLRVGKPDLWKRLVGIYLKHTTENLEILGRALNDDDFAAVTMTAHSLKSSTANMGEATAGEEKRDTRDALFAEIRREFKIVSSALALEGGADAPAEEGGTERFTA
jgi:signal transduction histidine kinase/CheY-like chemotaxis protein